MNKDIVLKWLRINVLFFVGAFIVALLLAMLFPDTLLGFVRGWGARSIAISSALLGETVSPHARFLKIFAWNGLMTLLFFVSALFFLAPLIAVIMGTFYSLGLMSALERGVTPLWHSPSLILVETAFILLTLTFASALGTEIFGVKPERKERTAFWRKNRKKLFPEQQREWKVVVTENAHAFILFIMLLLALLLFGAWFEVFL